MAEISGQYRSLQVDIDEGVALVTLNRPEAMNAVDMALHTDLENIFDDLGKVKEVRAIVLTGAGKAFSVGGDIGMMKAWLSKPDEPRVTIAGCYRIIDTILNLEKPLITAVNGHAIGLGATIALFGDVIFMAENARIGDPHVTVGLAAGDGGCVIWPLLIGVARAKEYLMTGDLMSAKEAERIGLVNRVLPPGEVLPAALAFARRLAKGPSLAISLTKAALNEYIKHHMNVTFRPSLTGEFLTMSSQDHAEGVNAFLEKRAPRYTGT